MLDFFGVPVKANDLLTRVQQLQLLAKRIGRYEDPVAQFRVLSYLKPSNWSKGCGWNQSRCFLLCNLCYYYFDLIAALLIVFFLFTVDDARLLLGIHYHGFGNWEKIRLDERLGLMKKIAPVELQHHETFLPRAPNLKDRANALLEQVCNYLNSNFTIMFFCFFCIYNLRIFQVIFNFHFFCFFFALSLFLMLLHASYSSMLITLHDIVWYLMFHMYYIPITKVFTRKKRIRGGETTHVSTVVMM